MRKFYPANYNSFHFSFRHGLAPVWLKTNKWLATLKRKATIIGYTSLFFIFFSPCYAQQLFCDNLLTMLDLSATKLIPYLSKNGFVYQGKNESGDTILNEFHCRQIFSKGKIDSTCRLFCRKEINQQAEFIYQTSSLPEFTALISSFKNKGFYKKEDVEIQAAYNGLFQFHDIRMATFFTTSDTINIYGLLLQKDKLPLPKNINYADDLLAFTSEECLQFYFGKDNVLADNYYFFDKEVAKCSVLFINTQRQVVYIWQDQKNKCGIRQLLFGGQQRLESAVENTNFIAENKWVSKSGLQAGMPLAQLRKLNGNNFKFQTGATPYFGAVIPDSTGKINFKREHIILSCINCKEEKFSTTPFGSADEAIADERIFFVLAVILNPL